MPEKELFKIFIVEDNELYAKVLRKQLENKKYDIRLFYSGQKCLANMNQKPSVVCLDYRLPDIGGDEMMTSLLAADSSLPVVVISGQDDIGTAVNLLKAGAYDYIVKGADTREKLVYTIKNIYNSVQLKNENETLKHVIDQKYGFRKLIKGNSLQIEKVFLLMEKAAATNISVSVTGETGTGKELVAKGIHFNSKRKNKPFVAVNVSAIPEGLIESELFGYEKGAFTGADSRKPGQFELANGGTLFLDEISDLDLNLQAKLLRVIQERELVRLGGTRTIPLDVRIITATHKNLEKLVSERKFRQDLYYRLLGLPIHLPPLRERGNDVIMLAKYFADEFCRDNEMIIKSLSPKAKEELLRYPFPGNIRELKAITELACVLSSEITLQPEHFQFTTTMPIAFLNEEKSMDEYTHDIISYYLEKYHQNVRVVADRLGIGKSTIYRFLQRNVDKPDKIIPR